MDGVFRVGHFSFPQTTSSATMVLNEAASVRGLATHARRLIVRNAASDLSASEMVALLLTSAVAV